MATLCHIDLTALKNKLSLFSAKAKVWHRMNKLTVWANSPEQALTAVPNVYVKQGYTAALFDGQKYSDRYDFDSPGKVSAFRGEMLRLYKLGAIDVHCEQPRSVNNRGETESKASVTRVSSIAAFNDRGQLLFGKRNDSGKWTLPGGHVEPGEKPEAAAYRELREETGLQATKGMAFIGTGVGGKDKDIKIYAYMCSVNGEATGAHDPDNECSEWRWVDTTSDTSDWTLPDEISGNLHSPENVTLQLANLQEATGVAEKPFHDPDDSVPGKSLNEVSASDELDIYKVNRHFGDRTVTCNIRFRIAYGEVSMWSWGEHRPPEINFIESFQVTKLVPMLKFGNIVIGRGNFFELSKTQSSQVSVWLDKQLDNGKVSAVAHLPVPKQFPKKCKKCGTVYHNLEEFDTLPAPKGGGVQNDGYEILHYRNCTCGSTMAVIVKVLKHDTHANVKITSTKLEEIAQELEAKGEQGLASELRTAADEYHLTDEWAKVGFDNAMQRPEEIADKVHDQSKKTVPNIPESLTSYQPPALNNPGFGGRNRPMMGKVTLPDALVEQIKLLVEMVKTNPTDPKVVKLSVKLHQLLLNFV